MTTKPTLIAASPGRALGYKVSNVDYNNDVLQLGNYVEEVLAGTNADKIPAAALTTPAWTTVTLFANSWVDAGLVAAVGYTKGIAGFVTLYGSIKSGTLGTTAFTLPVGFRPVRGQEVLGVVCGDTAPVAGILLVNTDGTVQPFSGNNTRFNLHGLRFATF